MFNYLGVVGSLFTSEEIGARRLMHGLVKLMQFCVSLIALRPQNVKLQTPHSCHFFIGLCSDPYLCSSMLSNDRKNINSAGSARDVIFAKTPRYDTKLYFLY